LGGEIFDLIYSVDVMEHIQDDMTVFKNFHVALKQNGILILHIPKKTQKFFLNFLGIFKTSQDDHVREGYDEHDISEIIKSTGFEILTIKNTFGMCTSFMWEMMQVFNHLGSAGNVVWKYLFSLLRPIVDREFKKPQKSGNGLLLLARKSVQID
jgi:2-polyprenyl-3-methyl-5-hydroxy-6-metoxy-1,4-benzoquinol methylase